MPQGGRFGMANYVASLSMLLALAIHIGRVRDQLGECDVRKIENDVRETIEGLRAPCQELAQRIRNDQFIFLGAGPNYATALFFAAKAFGLSRVNGVPQQMEEWAHEQYFLAGPGTSAFFLVPPGRSDVRASELLPVARQFGVRTVAVSEADSPVLQHADYALAIAGHTREEFSPRVYCVPGQLFAMYLAEAKGRPAFAFDSLPQKQLNTQTIQESVLSDE